MTHEQAIATHSTERYLLGEMPELERHQFEQHYFDCIECAEDVRVGALMREGARQVPSTRVARSAQSVRAWRPSVVLPWAAAATLAVAVGYQTLLVTPALRETTTARALTPVALRPASRGPAPVIHRPADGSPVLLAVDINAPVSSAGISYELRGPNGATEATGKAALPTGGQPLFLLLPSAAVSTPGEHTLHMIDAAHPEVEIGDYRFAVQ